MATEPRRTAKGVASSGEADLRVAPDPYAAVLPALSALGVIASIAAINWAAQDKTPERAKARRKAGTALRDLETCCLGLSEIFRRFQRNPKVYAAEGSGGSSPMKFGVHIRRVDPDGARLYQQIVNDIASMMVLAAQNSFDVMCAIEDGEINPPESIFYGLGDAQDRLNKLIQNRATLKVCVDTGLEVGDTLTKLVGELKKHRVE